MYLVQRASHSWRGIASMVFLYVPFIFAIVGRTYIDQYLLEDICIVLSVDRTRDMIVRFSVLDTEFHCRV